MIKKSSSDNLMIMKREPLQRADLSMNAKRVLAYLMTLPQDEVIHRTELATHFNDGYKAVRTAVNELIEAGYLIKTGRNVRKVEANER